MDRTDWKLNPAWLSEPSWADVAIAADRLTPGQVEAALAQLDAWFPPVWTDECTLQHPIAGKQLTYVGRLSLLELGHAAVEVQADDSFTARLRDPEQYLGADAELRAMLLLKLSGADLDRAPKGLGPRLSEFVATWSSGRQTVVEVKAIRVSDDVATAERLVTQFVFALGTASSSLPGFAGRVEWDTDVLFGSSPYIACVKNDVDAAIASAKATALSSQEFSVALGTIGQLCLKADSSRTSLYVDYGGYAPATADIFRRVRRRCNDAVQQLATHPTLPGLIVLDVDADGLARNGLAQLAGWTRSKQQLGAVFVVAREYNVRRSHGHVCVLPGPRFEGLRDAFESLERCDAGHLHFQPVCALEKRCPTAFGFH